MSEIKSFFAWEDRPAIKLKDGRSFAITGEDRLWNDGSLFP